MKLTVDFGEGIGKRRFFLDYEVFQTRRPYWQTISFCNKFRAQKIGPRREDEHKTILKE